MVKEGLCYLAPKIGHGVWVPARASLGRDDVYLLLSSETGFLQSLRHFLILPDKRSLLLQLQLQFLHRNLARNGVAVTRQRGGGSGGLAHRITGGGDHSGRLPAMG